MICCGFADDTDVRNIPGLNLDQAEMAAGVVFARSRGSKVLLAINSFPHAGNETVWHQGIADAETAGADVVILADLSPLAHAAECHPNLRRHLSVKPAAALSDIDLPVEVNDLTAPQSLLKGLALWVGPLLYARLYDRAKDCCQFV